MENMTMQKRVVVTGLGAVTPVGNTVDELWAGLCAGRSGLGPVTLFDASRLNSQVAAEVKGFEPIDYMPPKTAKRMARFSHFAVAGASQAWADAKLADACDLDRTGVIIGNGIGGNEVDCAAHVRLVTAGPRRIPAMTIPKMIVNEAAGNISMMLGIRGRIHTVVTACASGTDATGVALDAIRSGRLDVVVTGGCESAVTEYAMGGFCALKALSTHYNDCPEKASRPFDKDRDGFVMGEGAGILILESYGHAKARGAAIYAEVAGYGATGDAYHLTAPQADGSGAARAIGLALADAGMQPGDVDYVNAHGTSTAINDPTECKAIRLAFGAEADRLMVSSTKSMTGHCIGGAGGIEAIVCVKSITDSFVPPTLNLETPGEDCDLDCIPQVGRETPVRAAISTSLGFGGHNAVLLVKKFVE
jgi:3-oxoacyl-[acyl-carrier-protein] synthase II